MRRWWPGEQRVASDALGRTSEERARRLLPIAQREANRTGKPQAVVTENGRAWVWRADLVEKAIARDQAAVAQRRQPHSLFRNLRIFQIVEPETEG
jgi:hypothetical protein